MTDAQLGTLACAGCGARGDPPRIAWDRATAPGVTIVPVWGWHPDGRAALLCTTCRDRFRRKRIFKPRRTP